MKWVVIFLVALIIVGGNLFYGVLPQRFDNTHNAVIPHAPYAVSAEARALHQSIPLAGLHSDMLLWRRDPAKRNRRGHTDLVRLREGHVALQVFTAVTKTPTELNMRGNSADEDSLTMLMVAQAWPIRTWNSIYERAAYQAQRLAKLERDAPEEFVFVKNQADLDRALSEGKLAGVYGIEGAHPLEGALDNIDKLYDKGLRVMGLQHFFDNELGGSLHGKSQGGLTPFGEEAVDHAVEKGMIIDVAHSSEAVVRDVLARTSKPVILSHTGLHGACASERNISDETMKMIADQGGLVGIGFWDTAICDPTPAGIAKSIHYAVDFLGVSHVALGSDFDGTVTAPFDASELAALTQALMDEGLDNEAIRAVMGENAVAFFRENLPAE